MKHENKKAIIPAAGLGTRFLPATKAMPKEMLPIVDKPTIEYIVEEAINSGIEDIIIVTGKGKRAIEDHFDFNFELEHHLIKTGKEEILSKIKKSSNINIHYIRQKEPLGLGHAVWSARKFIGNEPFAVLLGDDIVESDEPCLKQMMNIYEKNNSSIIGVKNVTFSETSRYGIVDYDKKIGELYNIKKLVEKPLNNPPSTLAIMGRYVLNPEIFDILGEGKKGTGNEIQLTDAISTLSNKQNVYAYEFSGTRYDVGEISGFIKTNLIFYLENNKKNPEIVDELYRIIERYR
ncbi:UTP--glucose-1-phosphate uridylyltransferase GalU [Macrococcoides caseolyticum]|uniref:UTP--glucose-1-phosphate uridylyltransferase GalU n=1 Tax=Macrococcoides caseolyticum TaxID=69966 RepID=UPI000C329EE3|nr:UTP--glucose-1-phosphate uridylyltransferase GalU [Macrococcus caseolyticus]PKE50829.1 UTP--glucose-1-phosphate uridylyltransferase [Macrococcus caseolyticus]